MDWSRVSHLAEDRKGQIWLGTNSGVSCYDGSKSTTFTVQDGLAENRVRAIIEDVEGVLWFGTRGG